MGLVTVPFPLDEAAPPGDVRRVLREARRRIRRLTRSRHLPAFSSTDCGLVYAALRSLESSGLASGRWFCEWGSGLGVVACLAAMLGFEAWGIEAEGCLVRAARRFAADFDLAATFARGSYIPREAEESLLVGREFGWLSEGIPCGYEELGIGLDEFDVVFAYPWPDEEELIAELFAGHARPGALLLTYHGDRGLSLRRKGGR